MSSLDDVDGDPAARPERFVRRNRETLLRVIKHGDDAFVRALAIAALVEFGDDPTRDQIMRELEQLGDA